MQLLHRLNPAFVFSRAHASSSRLLAEQIFIVLVKLTLSSPNSKCPQPAWRIIASEGDLRLITYPITLRSLHLRNLPWEQLTSGVAFKFELHQQLEAAMVSPESSVGKPDDKCAIASGTGTSEDYPPSLLQTSRQPS
jgi:hypothetical protein